LGEERIERRLAAILCTDVVEYSRMMGADEEKALTALKSHRRELINPLIDQRRGRIFKTTGDGMLIEFASVVDAVGCAVVVQLGWRTATPIYLKPSASVSATSWSTRATRL
jgi:adenylate cyclase